MIIPPQYRLLASIGLTLCLCIASGLIGARVAAWKVEAGFSAERERHDVAVAKLKAENSDLTLALARQNGAVAAMKAEGEVAERARQAAVTKAIAEAKATAYRVGRIDAIKAETCDDVLKAYWGMTK